MTKRNKPERIIPEICQAVKRLRTHLGLSQARAAIEWQIAEQTLSRFELGKQTPRDPFVLMRLREAAADAGLAKDEELFNEALNAHPSSPPRPRPQFDPPWLDPSTRPPDPPTPTLDEWKLMAAARVAVRFYRDNARAMEKAAGPALDLVTEVLRSAPAVGRIDASFYRDLEKKLDELATRRVLEGLRKDGIK
jgi:transcriptional regulator with XRE-family HTH domain